jgi:hypothetical protein
MKETYYEIRSIDDEVTPDAEWFLHDPEGDEYSYNPSSLKDTTEVAKEISEDATLSNWVVVKITVEYVKVFKKGKLC